jgi:hypothetical protein
MKQGWEYKHDISVERGMLAEGAHRPESDITKGTAPLLPNEVTEQKPGR